MSPYLYGTVYACVCAFCQESKSNLVIDPNFNLHSSASISIALCLSLFHSMQNKPHYFQSTIFSSSEFRIKWIYFEILKSFYLFIHPLARSLTGSSISVILLCVRIFFWKMNFCVSHTHICFICLALPLQLQCNQDELEKRRVWGKSAFNYAKPNINSIHSVTCIYIRNGWACRVLETPLKITRSHQYTSTDSSLHAYTILINISFTHRIILQR